MDSTKGGLCPVDRLWMIMSLCYSAIVNLYISEIHFRIGSVVSEFTSKKHTMLQTNALPLFNIGLDNGENKTSSNDIGYIFYSYLDFKKIGKRLPIKQDYSRDCIGHS